MNILVCISSVPDTTSKINFTDNNTKFDSNGVQFVINPYDEFGLTKAVFLKEENQRLNKIYFTTIWVAILLVQFLIFSLIVYQQLLIQNPSMFFVKWLATSMYTLVFIGILQVITPLYKI